MKIMNLFRIILASAVVIAVQADAAPQKGKAKRQARVAKVQPKPSAVEIEAGVDAITDGVRQDLEIATNQAAEKIMGATLVKNNVIAQGLDGVMTQEDVKAIVAEQDAKIAQIKQNLMLLAEKAVATVDNAEKQASYASQFITGVQKFGSWIWNPAAQQERNLAQAIIIQLEEAKRNTTNPAIIKQLDQQINDQKLITGDKMSTRQLLLIGAVGAAATVAGVALGTNYFAASDEQQVINDMVKPRAPITEKIKEFVDKAKNVDVFGKMAELEANVTPYVAESLRSMPTENGELDVSPESEAYAEGLARDAARAAREAGAPYVEKSLRSMSTEGGKLRVSPESQAYAEGLAKEAQAKSARYMRETGIKAAPYVKESLRSMPAEYYELPMNLESSSDAGEAQAKAASRIAEEPVQTTIRRARPVPGRQTEMQKKNFKYQQQR